MAAILRQEEKYLWPEAYYHTTFHTLAAPQHTGNIQYNVANTISPRILTKICIKEYKPFNKPLYPYVTGKYPYIISIKTTPLLVNNTSSPHCPIPLHKTPNRPILQKIHNITVQWMCIDDTNAYNTIWYERQWPPPINCSIKNILTYKLNLNLFQKMKPNHPQSICNL